MQNIIDEALEELANGDAKYGSFDGPKDGVNTIEIEAGELRREIERENKCPERTYREAVQVAAMGLKMMRYLKKGC